MLPAGATPPSTTGDRPQRLLVCTVGGSPEPIVKSLLEWRPSRVHFVCSDKSLRLVRDAIVPAASRHGFDIDDGRWDLLQLKDEDNLQSCLEQVHGLTQVIEEWLHRAHFDRGQTYSVVADITGGTKCMSAALALEASRWPCEVCYVSGRERDKQGLGTVVSGTEYVVSHVNPRDALGYQAVDEFVALFNQHAYVPAANLANRTKLGMTRQDLKRGLSALENLALGFARWDSFDHHKAATSFKDVVNAANDFRAVLGPDHAGTVLKSLENWVPWLEGMPGGAANKPQRSHVLDLLANAKRRSLEGRLEDAVARLYRAIEAIAQLRLREQHNIETTKGVPLDKLPTELTERLSAKAHDGEVDLGLQDAYAVLKAKGDLVGQAFCELGLDRRESALNKRNNSILAHGFERVSDGTFDSLWDAAAKLMCAYDGVSEFNEKALPAFPQLSTRAKSSQAPPPQSL